MRPFNYNNSCPNLKVLMAPPCLDEMVERAKRARKFVEDEIKIDPDVWNRPTTI